PNKLAKKSIFERFKKSEERTIIDTAMQSALEAVKQKKILPTPELQEIWDNIEAKIENGDAKIHEIGIGGRSKDQLIHEIKNLGNEISKDALLMMEVMAQGEDFKASEKNQNQVLKIIELSVEDLGFSEKAFAAKVFERAVELGLQLCPAEIGPELRIKYQNQKEGEDVYVGMMPIRIGYGQDALVFSVDRRHQKSLLSIGYFSFDFRWHMNHRVVFVMPN
ncbi:hypothetical protein IT409_01755, partial [Candidatus Falkowbacteria bacterium]|nr:hypothetical protein [Candidatus Falkowbacteria bacterium]